MSARECGAKARTNGYSPCRQPAMPNGRCRLHGGLCTGSKTQKGRQKQKEANIRHGLYTAEAIAEQRAIKTLLKQLHSFI